MKKILILTTLLFLFSGCGTKIVYKDRLVCTQQLTIPKPKAEIRVYKDDVEVAKSYSESISSGFTFYENQVNRNNELCNEKHSK